jgi:hypothetical protein
LSTPKTTIICAVWSQDPSRYELLSQHQENLINQTCTVERIYVFDQSDTPPDFLTGNKIIYSEKLSIYEAWNLALSACRTEFVMNLNLDDRLCIDSVEVLEKAMMMFHADLVGGDWKICYSQESTNEVNKCFDANALPFLSEWPPVDKSITRLGSGDGHRGTYGPATMWRLDNHIGIPRYPYRTVGGDLIRGISDSVWWGLLQNNFGKKLMRLPIIIGNYYSHPSSQAEFRNLNEWDLIRENNISLV